MNEEIQATRIGLLLVMLTLLFGISLGITFGVAEDSVKSYISDGIESHASVHDDKSNSKIWRYVQRAHFHATGIAAFTYIGIGGLLSGFAILSANLFLNLFHDA
jgi:hypothetical protein